MYYHRLCIIIVCVTTYISCGKNYTPYEKQVLLGEKESVFEKFQLVKWYYMHVKW